MAHSRLSTRLLLVCQEVGGREALFCLWGNLGEIPNILEGGLLDHSIGLYV